MAEAALRREVAGSAGTGRQSAVRQVLDKVKAEGRLALTAPEGKLVCDAYGIPVPKEGVANSAEAAAKLASGMGFPVVLKIVSPDILHKTEAGGVLVGLKTAEEVAKAYDTILASAKKYKADAKIEGVQVQQMLKGGTEVIVGAITDGSFGKLVAFGLGGVLVEVLKDVTFRLAPATSDDALSMLDGIQAAEMLRGVRGGEAVEPRGARRYHRRRSRSWSATSRRSPRSTSTRFSPPRRTRPPPTCGSWSISSRASSATGRRTRKSSRAMNRIMKPKGRRGDRRLRRGRQDRQLGDEEPHQRRLQGRRSIRSTRRPTRSSGCKAYKSVKDVPGEIDVAVFAIPAKFVARRRWIECGEKKIPGAVLIPSGFAETGNARGLQDEIRRSRASTTSASWARTSTASTTRRRTSARRSARPTTSRARSALSSQSGGIGMAIIGFSRSAKMGVSAIVGLGNKSDIDEDDLLTFFEQDDNTQVIAQHCEDLKDGRAFAEVAKRVSKKKPVVMLKAGRTSAGAQGGGVAHRRARRQRQDLRRRAAPVRRHPGARASTTCSSSRAACQVLPTPKGENVVIITGAGGSGVLLSDACVDNGLSLMAMPPDLDAAFRKFIPPFGAAGNPVDITGGEPPTTYQNTVKLGLEDAAHPRADPRLLAHDRDAADGVREAHGRGRRGDARTRASMKPVVASLAGDVQVEEAAEYLYQHGIPAYAVLDRDAGRRCSARSTSGPAARGCCEPSGRVVPAVAKRRAGTHSAACRVRGSRIGLSGRPGRPGELGGHERSSSKRKAQRRSAPAQRPPRLRPAEDARDAEGPAGRSARRWTRCARCSATGRAGAIC